MKTNNSTKFVVVRPYMTIHEVGDILTKQQLTQHAKKWGMSFKEYTTVEMRIKKL